MDVGASVLLTHTWLPYPNNSCKSRELHFPRRPFQLVSPEERQWISSVYEIKVAEDHTDNLH